MKNKYESLSHRLLEFAKDFDFIGPQFSLQNSSSSRFQSVQGTCWSLLTLIIMMVAGFMLGREVYERKMPRVSSNRENISDSSIYFNQFPIMFTLITQQGRVLNNSDFREYLEPFIMRIVYDQNGVLTIDNKISDFEKCDISKFNKFQDLVRVEVSNYNDDRYLCLKFYPEDFFSNTIFAIDSTNYNIGFRKCKVNCAKDVDEIVNHILLDVIYINSFVDINSYSSPIQIYLEHLTTQLELSLFRRSYMRFVYNELKSDYGWITEINKLDIIPYLESLVPDDMGYLNNGDFKDGLFLLSVESPKSKMVFHRNYMKIQELLATLGGLANAVIMGIRILSHAHLKFILLFFIKGCALQSIEKQFLENSFDKGKSSSKQMKINSENKSKNTTLTAKQVEKNSNSRANFEDIPNSSLKKDSSKSIGNNSSSKRIDHGSASNVQTIVELNYVNNYVINKGQLVPIKESDEKDEKDSSWSSSKSDSRSQVKSLSLIKSKTNFYSSSANLSLLTSVKENESFYNYICSLVFLKKERVKYYRNQIKSITSIISIHTYTNLVMINSGDLQR